MEQFPLSKIRVTDSTWPGDPPMAIDQLGGQSGEGRPIGRVAGVGLVAQGEVEIGGHRQGQADDPQGGAAFLARAALGEGAAVVEAIDEGEEIGGVEEDPADVAVAVADQVVGQIAFDPLDGLGGDAGHGVPGTLAGELLGADIEEPSRGGALEPAGHLDLAAGCDRRVHGREEPVRADGRCGAGLGDVAVDGINPSQLLGEVKQGHDGAEVGDPRLAGLGGSLGIGRGRSEGGDDVVGATEVLLPDDGGLAVDAAPCAGVVGGTPAEDRLDEAGHGVGHT